MSDRPDPTQADKDFLWQPVAEELREKGYTEEQIRRIRDDGETWDESDLPKEGDE